MTKILVTGSRGQLGSELRNKAASLPSVKFIFTDIQELDITNKQAVESFLLSEKPDFLVNCAAYTAVDIAERDLDLAEALNAFAPAYLGESAHKTGCKIIHVSTDYVFDGCAFQPYTEEVLPNPQSVYGKTKLMGEKALQSICPDALIVRTSWLYSAHGNNFVKTMVRLGKEREELRVVYDQIGTPTAASDLAQTILTIISSNTETGKWCPGIYHYSNEGVCSWYDFALAIHKQGNISCNVIPIETSQYPTPARRPPYSVLNKSKIKRIFDIQIPHWADSLSACIAELNK